LEVRARRTYNLTGKPFIDVTFSPDQARVIAELLDERDIEGGEEIRRVIAESDEIEALVPASVKERYR
jgi:hypothetical protein